MAIHKLKHYGKSLCLASLSALLFYSPLTYADTDTGADTGANSDSSQAPTSHAETNPLLPAAAHRSYKQNYKDMALAHCIGTAYEHYPKVLEDAGATTGAFFHWGHYDFDASNQELPALIDDYLSRPYVAKQGDHIRLDLMKCIDMYHSPELEALSNKFVIDPASSFVKDNPNWP